MNDYLEYLKNGHNLISFIFNKPLIFYNSNNYSSIEGRRNSEDAEKDIIKSLITNNNKYKLLENIDLNEYSNGKFWYKYYQNLENGIILVIPQSHRHWFDIAIIDNNKSFYPINIKITNGNTTDNLFGLMTLKYLLFGYDFIGEYGTHNIKKINNEIIFAERIINNIIKNQNGQIYFRDFDNDFQGLTVRDYFFLSINKQNNNISISSYLNIPNELIKINPKNMFQAKIHEINGIDLNNIDFQKNIIKVIYQFYEYARKKAEVFYTLERVLG